MQIERFTILLAFLYSITVTGSNEKSIEQLRAEIISFKDIAPHIDTIENDTLFVESLLYFVDAYRTYGAWDSSKILADYVISLSQQLSYLPGEMEAYNKLGILSKNQAKYKEAEQYYNKSLSICTTIKDTLMKGKTYGNLAAIYRNKGQFDQAIEFYLKSLREFEKLNNQKFISMCYSGIGLIYFAQMKYHESIDYHLKALQINTNLKNEKGIAHNYNNLANVYTEMKEHSKAMEYNQKAIKFYLKFKDYRNEAISWGNMATLYFTMFNEGKASQTNLIDSALKYNHLALEMRTKLNDATGLVRSYCMFGEIYRSINALDKSLQNYLKALDLANSIGSMRMRRIAHEGLAYIYEARKDHKLALEHYRHFSIIKDSIYNESKSKEIGKLEAQYEMEKKQEEEKRQKELAQEKLEEQQKRRDNLQYSGIFVVVLILFALVFMSGKFTLSERFAEGLIFFTFLLFFEFMLVLLDPLIEEWSGGQPAYKLVFNAVLAGLIFPLHAFFEATLKTKLLRKDDV